MRERVEGEIKEGPSVGAVLFVMRNGKPATYELDNWAYDLKAVRKLDRDVAPTLAVGLDAAVGLDTEVGSI
jgi:hypothetical protein